MQRSIIVLVLTLVSFLAYAGGEEVGEGDTTAHVNFNGIFPEIFDSTIDLEEPQTIEEQVGAIKGVIERVEGGGFRYLVLRDEEGNRHKLLWLHNFNGSDLLNQRSNKWLGKKVTVEYQALKCYMPKEHAFIVVPQMRGLSIAD